MSVLSDPYAEFGVRILEPDTDVRGAMQRVADLAGDLERVLLSRRAADERATMHPIYCPRCRQVGKERCPAWRNVLSDLRSYQQAELRIREKLGRVGR